MTGTQRERVNQKLRTRMALLEATRRLIERGATIGIAAVAKEAGVSAATAYRYFSDPELLKAEALLHHDFARSGDLLAEYRQDIAGIDDVAERVIAVHRLLMRFVRRNEALYRAFVARSIEAGGAEGATPQRAGRRIPMLDLALEPLRGRLTDATLRDLVLSLSAVVGFETELALVDICQLDRTAANRIAEQTIRLILTGALAGAEPRAG